MDTFHVQDVKSGYYEACKMRAESLIKTSDEWAGVLTTKFTHRIYKEVALGGITSTSAYRMGGLHNVDRGNIRCGLRALWFTYYSTSTNVAMQQ